MNRQTLLRFVAEMSAYPSDVCEKVLGGAFSLMGDALSRGEEVDLNPDFGRLVPKWNDNPGRNADSPRSPKVPEYHIRFRPGPELTRKLRERGNTQ